MSADQRFQEQAAAIGCAFDSPIESGGNEAPAVGDAGLAGRAIGAMFLAVFGGLWLALWAHAQYAGSVLAMVVVAVLGVALCAAALSVYRRHSGAVKALAQTPERRRRTRLFHLVNGGQWIVILAAAFALGQAGLQTWILPMVILVIGLHFFPLARLFGYRMHYGTGAALVLVAATYPFVAPDGPASASGPLAAGIILWLSAGLAISPLASRRGPADAGG